MANFLTYPIFTDVILPFLLIFTLIFAVLQKSKLLGEGKQQIDAILAFVIAALIVGGFSAQINWIKQFAVFLGVALVILFVFMLIYGFVYSDNKEGFKLGDNWKIGIAVIAAIAVVVLVLNVTGYWSKVYDFFTNGELGSNIIFIILIIIAVMAVLKGQGGSSKPA